jgi:pectate lyase
VTWTADNYIAEASSLPVSVGETVTVPYNYTVTPYKEIPALVKTKAGATLFSNR